MGWEEGDLRTVLKYIRDKAPIIIHVDLSTVLKYFLKDTHYRNQFETNKSRGTLSHTARRDWENRMFNKIYKKSTPGFERVKYGVLNMVNDPNGIATCVYYGDSFFELKKVRLRTSFADRDTSDCSAQMASCEYYCHVLASYSDEDLKNVLDVAKNIDKDPRYGKPSSPHDWNYKEIQIHGEVRFDTHIAALRINVRHQRDSSILKKIKKFVSKNQITDVTFQDGEDFFKHCKEQDIK